MKYHYTDKELKTLLSSMTVIIDTREQQNSHIIEYLDKRRISHINKKLDYGDYTCMLPSNSELGIMRNTYFTDSMVIERKANLEELSNNLTADRTRFESELIRSHGCNLLLLIENSSYGDIVAHKYKTQYEPKSFVATLHTYTTRYNLNINFVPAAYAGNFIYFTLLYHCREYLKGGIACCINA